MRLAGGFTVVSCFYDGEIEFGLAAESRHNNGAKFFIHICCRAILFKSSHLSHNLELILGAKSHTECE